MVLAAAALAAQVGVESPHVGTAMDPCPNTDCHIAPYFKGDKGGLVVKTKPVDMTATNPPMPEYVVDCGGVSVTVPLTPDSINAVLLDSSAGTTCGANAGRLTVFGAEDGGWYYIHDTAENSAVSPLISSKVLGNANMVRPIDPGGLDSEHTTDYATLLRDPMSGHVGILNHIMPTADMAPMPVCRQSWVTRSGARAATQVDQGCQMMTTFSIRLYTVESGVERTITGPVLWPQTGSITLFADVWGDGHLAAQGLGAAGAAGVGVADPGNAAAVALNAALNHERTGIGAGSTDSSGVTSAMPGGSTNVLEITVPQRATCATNSAQTMTFNVTASVSDTPQAIIPQLPGSRAALKRSFSIRCP